MVYYTIIRSMHIYSLSRSSSLVWKHQNPIYFHAEFRCISQTHFSSGEKGTFFVWHIYAFEPSLFTPDRTSKLIPVSWIHSTLHYCIRFKSRKSFSSRALLADLFLIFVIRTFLFCFIRKSVKCISNLNHKIYQYL